MKKKIIILSCTLIVMAFTISYFTTENVWAKSGKKLFQSNGCIGCHLAGKKGVGPKREHMVTLSFKKFWDCVHNGRTGTAMTPKKHLSKKQVKKIYHWLKDHY